GRGHDGHGAVRGPRNAGPADPAETGLIRRASGRRMSEPDIPPRQLERIRQLREADVAIIGIAAWRPWPLGRDETPVTSPECRQWSLVCSHVPVPPAPLVRSGGSAARPLRARSIRVEPRSRAALALA